MQTQCRAAYKYSAWSTEYSTSTVVPYIIAQYRVPDCFTRVSQRTHHRKLCGAWEPQSISGPDLTTALVWSLKFAGAGGTTPLFLSTPSLPLLWPIRCFGAERPAASSSCRLLLESTTMESSPLT